MAIDERRPRLKGVQYVVDETGKRKAVLIDLGRHQELWEDFYDSVVADARKHEPRESLESVKRKVLGGS
jgi:hypothetical protein